MRKRYNTVSGVQNHPENISRHSERKRERERERRKERRKGRNKEGRIKGREGRSERGMEERNVRLKQIREWIQG